MYNPFSFLFPVKLSPWSRLINSSYPRRVLDTFIVFFGSVDFFNVKRVGIFDYLTVFLCKGLSALLEKAVDKATDNAWYMVAAVPLLLLYALSLVPRFVLSVAATLILMPFVAIAHAVIYYKKTEALEKKMLMLEAANIDNSGENTLGSYLKFKKLDMDDVDSLVITRPVIGNNAVNIVSRVMGSKESEMMLTLCFRYDEGRVSWGKWLFNRALWLVGKCEAQFEISLDPKRLSQDNKIAMGALLKLNYAGVTKKIEEDKLLPHASLSALIALS